MAAASTEHGASPAPCRALEWDSEHFGFPIAEVNGNTLDAERAEEVDAWCRERGIRCLYLLADAEDADTSRLAQERGYMVVDSRLTIRHPLGPIELETPPPPGWVVRDADEQDLERARALAARSHHATRFYFDRGFPRDRCDALYEEWVMRGMRDDFRCVHVAEVGGEFAGYQVIRAPDAPGDNGVLELLAVEEEHRRAGVGAHLLANSLGWLRDRGAEAVLSALQARNVLSVRVHERVGFLVDRAETWHHRWYE